MFKMLFFSKQRLTISLYHLSGFCLNASWNTSGQEIGWELERVFWLSLIPPCITWEICPPCDQKAKICFYTVYLAIYIVLHTDVIAAVLMTWQTRDQQVCICKKPCHVLQISLPATHSTWAATRWSKYCILFTTETLSGDKMKNSFNWHWRQLLWYKFYSDLKAEGWESNATVCVKIFFFHFCPYRSFVKISITLKDFTLCSVP